MLAPPPDEPKRRVVAVPTVIGAAIAAASAVDPSSLGDEALQASVFATAGDANRLAAHQASLVGPWESSGTWALDRSKSAAARYSRETGCSIASAKAVVRRARGLRSMPLTAAALAAGTLAVDRVDVLVEANRPGVRQLFQRDEQQLLAQGATLVHFADFLRLVAHWVNIAEDETCEERADQAEKDQTLQLRRRRDGTVDLKGHLAPVDGAIVATELERLEDELFRQDWAEARERCGDDVCLDRLARDGGQRRAAALALMARRSAAMPPDARPARPLLTVLVGYETFAGRVCELANGTVLTPGQVAGLLGEADIERVVFDTPSRVIDVGRRTRFFTGGLRRAIEVRDRFCSIDGCHTPAERCEVDHVVEHGDGGETTQENGRLLCPFHNRQRPGRSTPPTAEGP